VNWQASAIGAIVVLAGGAAVGVAVGSKESTKVRTATLIHTVKVVTTVAAAPPKTSSTAVGGSQPSAATSTTPGSAANAGERYLADYLESEGGSDAVDANAENASMLSNPNQQELGGQLYQHAVAIQLDAQDENVTASIQMPTPGFSRLSSPAVGLATTTNANAAYRLTVYKNDDSSPSSVVLYQASFHGPSTIRKVTFALQEAADIVLVWTHKAPEPDDQDTFILADPVLTGQ
jgi:hypothetical protein